MSHHDHGGLADALGIPEPLVHLEDAIFERLGGVAQRSWPERFYTALPEGADLSGVWPLFAVWMLREVVFPVAGSTAVVVERVARSIETNWPDDDYGTAWNAACDAGAAAGAAANAAWAAARIDARVSSRSAAVAVTRAATQSSARAAARAAWTRMADKLCELMAACGGTVA